MLRSQFSVIATAALLLSTAACCILDVGSSASTLSKSLGGWVKSR
jgi:hypothetical protein